MQPEQYILSGAMLKLTPLGSATNVSEGDRKLELLLDLGAMLAREVELDQLLRVVGERVAAALNSDRATLWLVDSKDGSLRSRVANLPELDELSIPAGQGIVGHVATTGKSVNIPDARNDSRWAPEIDRTTGYQTISLLCTPVRQLEGKLLGVIQVLNKREGHFDQRDLVFLDALADQIARALAYTTLRSTAGTQGVPLRGPFNHIVGSSDAMNKVYERILKTARTDATVLLHGETGTGKGLFARAIHVNSPRSQGPLVHVDCTNLPASLVESELFGHERGAYTGADSRVIGKVEQANGGTLFLDEIGELPLALQSKLLRFLQDRSYERVGGRETLVADLRLVAATNRNLQDMVDQGEFRSDLYYRLRVIDIALPALRDRNGDDLRALAEHFLSKYCRRYKRELRFSEESLALLCGHTWPGNVRELEHCIERAVVLASTPILSGADMALEQFASRGPIETATGPGSPNNTVEFRLPADCSLDQATALFAQQAVDAHDGNRSAAARTLQISRNRLSRLLR